MKSDKKISIFDSNLQNWEQNLGGEDVIEVKLESNNLGCAFGKTLLAHEFFYKIKRNQLNHYFEEISKDKVEIQNEIINKFNY